MKENLEKALKNIKNLNVRNHFKTTVALLTMSSVLALTGCNGIRKANTDDVKNKAAYETEIEEETKETIEEVQEKEETVEEETAIEVKEEIEEEAEELSEFDMIDLSFYEGYKLEHALELGGYESSFGYRKQIAEHLEIENYKGTASQNLEILERLGAKVTVDVKTSNKVKDEQDNKVEVSMESKESQDNKSETSEETIATPGTSSGSENEKTHGNSGGDRENNNSEDNQTAPSKKPVKPINPTVPGKPEEPIDPSKPTDPEKPEQPTDPSKPVEPEKPEHICSFNEWYSKDDEYEESICECGQKNTRLHKYDIKYGKYTPNNNGTHSVDITKTCINCGHTVSLKETDECKYTTIIGKDDTYETKQCACGATEDVLHVWDEGVLDSNNNTVYTCTNQGCGYSYKVEHHIVEETKEKKSEENLCRIVVGKCIVQGCEKIIYTIEDTEHDFFVEQPGDGKVADILKCRDCDYRTKDPNFVPTTPVFPDFPDDEEEEEISTYSVDYSTEVQNSDFFVPETNFVSESSVTENFVETEIEETKYEVITTPLESSEEDYYMEISNVINEVTSSEEIVEDEVAVDSLEVSEEDYYTEISNIMDEAILPAEDKDAVEEESAENVLKLSL